jgi:hypothetical protein
MSVFVVLVVVMLSVVAPTRAYPSGVSYCAIANSRILGPMS